MANRKESEQKKTHSMTSKFLVATGVYALLVATKHRLQSPWQPGITSLQTLMDRFVHDANCTVYNVVCTKILT